MSENPMIVGLVVAGAFFGSLLAGGFGLVIGSIVGGWIGVKTI